MAEPKIVFIEFDGASWNVVEPLLDKGRLPNIRRLLDRGVSGTLLSDPPLLSPRLWVSIFTGKHSRKHGVEFFGNSSSMVKCKRIWDIFHERGLKVGVFGSFVTWPPYPVKGFMIPSLFALGPETYPEQYRFLQELTISERGKGKPGVSTNGSRKSKLYYAMKMKTNGVSLSTLAGAGFQLVSDRLKRASRKERHWKKAVAHLKISTEVFVHLLKKYKPNFSTFHIHLCDALSHQYWKYYEPERFHDVDVRLAKRLKGVIPNAYIESDRAIGKVLETVDDDTLVVVVSDHGSEAMDSSRMAYRLHVENFLDRYRLRESVIPAHVGLMTFCYFRDDTLMERMHAAFEAAAFSDTDEKVFDVIREESLLGIRLSQKLWGKEVEADRFLNLGEFDECRFSELFIPQRMEVSGTHKKEGLLIMAGVGIKRGVRVDGASIFDVTPTALALSGMPVARDMDGRVITEAIDEEFLRENPLKFIESYEEPEAVTAGEAHEAKYEDIKGQLKSLGYL